MSSVPTDPLSLICLALAIAAAVYALAHGAGSPAHCPPPEKLTAADHERIAADLLDQACKEWGTKVPMVLAARAQAHAQLAASMRIAEHDADRSGNGYSTAV
jgi:hypothetical protein